MQPQHTRHLLRSNNEILDQGLARVDREQDFIEATWQCLRAYGAQGTTVRRIAQAAGVTPGLLIHYFAGKDALIARSYERLAEAFLDHLNTAASQHASPQDQLTAFLQASLNDQPLGSDTLPLWVHYWGLVGADPAIRKVHVETDRAFRARLSELVEAAFPHPHPARNSHHADDVAQLLSATLDGYWLAWGLAPDAFNAQKAVAHLKLIAAMRL